MYAIPNLSSQTAFTCDPWTFSPDIPDNVKRDKATFIEWCQQPTTKHCHFSACEGMDSMRRVNADNPVVQIHGFVADYDSVVPMESIKALIKKCPIEYVPNWASNTFSGGARLVWCFEKPVLVRGFDMAKAFMLIAKKKLKLNKFFAGLDEDAFLDTAKYYERGREWVILSNDKIPMAMLQNWLLSAGDKLKWSDGDSIRIPINRVYEEVIAKFPGRWNGPFDVGTRGVRFWDSEADNGTAAVVRETGMQCFTGVQPFVSWKEIFGPKFVEQYEADTIGALIESFWFDGTTYWTKSPIGGWESISKEDLKLGLTVRHGLSKNASKGVTYSEVDRVLHAVQVQKRVVAALPFVHFPDGVFRAPDGQLYLNISRAKAMKPSDTPCRFWGDGFPWLANFLDGFFLTKKQLPYFLTWWRLFYESALNEKPRSGQALFLIGPTQVGKTLISTGIIGPTVGGCADASAFLMGEEKFTSHILQSPIMAVDDTCPAANSANHIKYSAMIKKVVANRMILFEEKFQKAGHVTWLGRIIVTGNDDPESLRLLPNVDISLMDKVSFFHCAKRPGFSFGNSEELTRMLSIELPRFCRWLLDWDIPSECIGTERFGAVPYHDPLLLSGAISSSGCFMFLETLEIFLTEWSLISGKTVWEGTATELVLDMATSLRLAHIVSKYTATSVSTWLGQLQSKGVGIEYTRTNKARNWNIPVDIKASKLQIEIEETERLEEVNAAEAKKVKELMKLDRELLNHGNETGRVSEGYTGTDQEAARNAAKSALYERIANELSARETDFPEGKDVQDGGIV